MHTWVKATSIHIDVAGGSQPQSWDKNKAPSSVFFAQTFAKNSQPPNFDVGGADSRNAEAKKGHGSSSVVARLQPMHARRLPLLLRYVLRTWFPAWSQKTSSKFSSCSWHAHFEKSAPRVRAVWPNARMASTPSTIQISIHAVLIIFYAESGVEKRLSCVTMVTP